MSFREVLQDARESAASAFHQFLNAYPKYPDGVHAFFEGHADASFYSGYIYTYLSPSRHLEPYKCGGKRSVLDTYRKVRGRVREPRVALFFVDRDFADFIPDGLPVADTIYRTDYYSIENYVVNDHVLRRTVVELVNNQSTNIDIEAIIAQFVREESRFHEFVRPLIAWLICAKRQGFDVEADEIKLGQLFGFDEEACITKTILMEKPSCYAAFAGMCNSPTATVDPAEVESMETELENIDPKQYVRGKYELWFLIQFLNAVMRILRTLHSGDGPRVSTSPDIGGRNPLALLGPRARIPPSLQAFLELHLAS